MQASRADQLVRERRVDPCLSELFSWQEIPEAHMKMMRNEQGPGNMAALVQAPVAGLRSLEDSRIR